MPNERQSVSAAGRDPFGSRLVPRVTSPPAQTRNGAESDFGLADRPRVDGVDWASASEAKYSSCERESAGLTTFTDADEDLPDVANGQHAGLPGLGMYSTGRPFRGSSPVA